MSRTRGLSTMLFTSILTVAAKSFVPALYPQLLNYARQLLSRAMMEGKGDLAFVQSICLLVFWKVSREDALLSTPTEAR